MPMRSSHPGSGRASLYAPIPVLLRIEFTAMGSLQPSSELLPHFSTLTSSTQTSHPLPRRCAAGLIRSVASPLPSGSASLGSVGIFYGGVARESEQYEVCADEAVYLCCTFPEVAFGGRYPLSLPCGARTFLMTGLSAWPRDCLSYSRQLFYRSKQGMSMVFRLFRTEHPV